jgi:hypothetical protein
MPPGVLERGGAPRSCNETNLTNPQLTSELERVVLLPVESEDGEGGLTMPHSQRELTAPRALRVHQRDVLKVEGQAGPTVQRRAAPEWPPVPDLFDVITYFRARGDSFALIASIGFWVGDDPKKALTARGLKLWYEAECERRAAARATIR